MKRILILGSESSDPEATEAKQFMRDFFAQALGDPEQYQVVFCHFDELEYVLTEDQISIRDTRNNTLVNEYQAIYMRGTLSPLLPETALVATYAASRGVSVINHSHVQYREGKIGLTIQHTKAVGKLSQMFLFKDLQLPIPATVAASHNRLPQLIDEHLEYPVVVKDTNGGMGSHNYLVHSKDELQKILADAPEVSFIAQELIPNDGDYRILCIGPKAMVIHRKGSAGSHLNNTSQGGKATLVPEGEFPQEIITASKKLADTCQYEIAGVDVIFSLKTGKHYYLEINSQPQIVNGAFTEEKSQALGDYLRSVLA